MRLLEDHNQFGGYIKKMDETVRRFFWVDFDSKSYRGTRDELRYRLDTLLRNKTFRRIFSAKKNQLDMYQEMDVSRLMLLDTK